jgi:hypothetical protein
VIASFRQYEQNLTDLKSANEKIGKDDHWIVIRILCFPSHVNASFLREATLLGHAEMEKTTALQETGRHLYSFTTALSAVQHNTEADYLLQDDIDSLDYIIEDANWM